MKNLNTMRAIDDTVVKMECYDRLDSTVALAREYANAGYPDRYAVVAAAEGAGEAESAGLYVSVILRPSLFPSQTGLLSSLAAVAFLQALEEHTTARLGIGWVSNIFCEGEYIGGVTVEGKLDAKTLSYEYIIVRFGARLPQKHFPPMISDLIKKVFEAGNDSITTIFAKSVINKFLPLYTKLKSSRKFMDVYKQRFILSGVRAKYTDSEGKKSSCKIVGVDTGSGGLIIEIGSKRRVTVTSQAYITLPKTVKMPRQRKARYP